MPQDLNRIFSVEYADAAGLSPVSHNGYRLTSTANPPTALVVDGANPAVGDWLVLVNQADSVQNGLWQVDQVAVVGVTPWSLVRGNVGSSLLQNQLIYVIGGASLAGTLHQIQTADPITSGATALTIGQVDINNVPEANIATFALTFTVNPPPAADDAATVADGNAITAAETSEVLNDLAAKLNAVLGLLQTAGIMA